MHSAKLGCVIRYWSIAFSYRQLGLLLIRDQADDATCSIPSNIMEGSSRRSEKRRSTVTSNTLRGPAFELQTRMMILQRRGWSPDYRFTLSGVTDLKIC
ncbi:MAG: four helix bundle protein [Flavobacteriales bacterium]|nr:four helix bundle protein [Flavobacteriales bacterium]MBK6946579.1 four helix bundle protein [Flavobacteriales bacterium]MBK7239684.1 four helix bundle protein [Flavobacteriales bacterium]MBK7298707.1 four helix bundle protein [Flavobacteriales bacterium]MBK9536629.1 four helix bundle protein [Flavobacteriales bacterium]